MVSRLKNVEKICCKLNAIFIVLYCIIFYIFISGPDGKPTAVDHVLELVENHAANIKGLQPESGSDSDDDWSDYYSFVNKFYNEFLRSLYIKKPRTYWVTV